MVDFRYIDDALTPREALDILRAARGGRQERIAELERAGYPAYTSTPGWIGYCRVAGVNENIAILLLAAKFGVPVWQRLRRQ
jgi:hypothetical protein